MALKWAILFVFLGVLLGIILQLSVIILTANENNKMLKRQGEIVGKIYNYCLEN